MPFGTGCGVAHEVLVGDATGLPKHKGPFRVPAIFYNNNNNNCLKFCVSNGITARESFKMLQKCFVESTFSEDRKIVENLPHASGPSTFVNNDNIEKVKKIVSKIAVLALER